jgi:hypothetical protein
VPAASAAIAAVPGRLSGGCACVAKPPDLICSAAFPCARVRLRAAATQPASYRTSPACDERRLLLLLAESPDGCTDALLTAHGFRLDVLISIVSVALATAQPERTFGAGKPVEVTRVRITDAGRRPARGHAGGRPEGIAIVGVLIARAGVAMKCRRPPNAASDID